jgi:predicted amidohydrolase YtcJ
MLLVNGTVYTFDAANKIAQAVAIRGNKIVGVGSNDDMRKAFVGSNVIDLQGKTVLPGLVDGHGHILGEGTRLVTLGVFGARSAQEVADSVGSHVGDFLEEQWILGRGWDQNDWEIKEFPTHEVLDKVSPNNPVVLRRVDGHAMWVNKMVLDIAGITAASPEVDGGKIYRDAKGNPTGIFVDNAMDLVEKVIPELTDQEIEDRAKLALEECAQNGLTEVQDMGANLQTLNAFKRLIDKGQCPIRINAAIGGDGETWEHYLTTGPEINYGGMLTVRSIKLYMDGALGSRGAALLDEYSDDPQNRGLTLMRVSEVDSVCAEALAHGFQVRTHAIGDRGNFIILNAYERALATLPPGAPSPRWRVEHAQVLQQTDIPRFAKLGIIPSMQPTHATSDLYWAEARLGKARLKGAYAWQSIRKTGSIIVGGSDFPVESVNPLWGIYAAITRSDRTGYPADGWIPEQKLSREDAVRMFSQWAAYGVFEDDQKGTIESGKWADLTIVSKDIMQVDPKEILSTNVDMTIVNGKVVYQSPALAQ